MGKLLSETFLISIINLNKQIFYYLLGIIIFVTFLISINFNIFWFFNLVKKIIFKLFSKNKNILTSEENINNEVKNLSPIFNKPIQEDLPFADSKNTSKLKFKLPSMIF